MNSNGQDCLVAVEQASHTAVTTIRTSGPSIWVEDIRLMRKANVNVVALGIFSWDRIQPAEHEWDFGWLDRIIGMLGDAGISVDLASATASAPLWLYEQYPQVLPRDKFGHAINAGSRQSWSASSPVFREHALELCNRLA